MVTQNYRNEPEDVPIRPVKWLRPKRFRRRTLPLAGVRLGVDRAAHEARLRQAEEMAQQDARSGAWDVGITLHDDGLPSELVLQHAMVQDVRAVVMHIDRREVQADSIRYAEDRRESSQQRRDRAVLHRDEAKAALDRVVNQLRGRS